MKKRHNENVGDYISDAPHCVLCGQVITTIEELNLYSVTGLMFYHEECYYEWKKSVWEGREPKIPERRKS